MASQTAPLLALILGGARSGKSRRAEALAGALASEHGLSKTYIATAQAYDDEMRARIAAHKQQRAGEGWQTLEEEHALARVLKTASRPDTLILIDCLTLWLSNRVLADADVDAEIADLSAALEARWGPVICVSNEVGLGIVPETSLGRAFRDHQGRLNQRVAELATRVEFVAAGLPLTLKED
ncbi:MAG: bifunctional adenosylcobinamide kinase/adenosylcobinamide-phosphate guanylyltransferase [Devosiaceae bacterium]|nr:bifunctional adenosylcobinamide kinase/adenosylcobinamide-phosphate guanylyltransferase [Devosiaceae bacterium MH13]